MERRLNSVFACCVAIAVAVPCTGPARGSEAANGPDDASPDPKLKAENAAAARSYLLEAAARYLRLRSYQDEMIIRVERERKRMLGFTSRDHREMRFRFKYQRPLQFALVGKDDAYYCDGEKVRRSCLGENRWVISPLDNDFAIDCGGYWVETLDGHPLLNLLLRPGNPESDLAPDVSAVVGIQDEPRNGRPGKCVSLQLALPRLESDTTVPAELWFDDADGLLRELIIDLRGARWDDLDRAPSLGALAMSFLQGETLQERLVVRLERVDKDVSFAPETFSPAPPEGATVADRSASEFTAWIPKWRSLRSAELIHTQCPPFVLLDVNDRVWRLEDLRGKVVVLAFTLLVDPDMVEEHILAPLANRLPNDENTVTIAIIPTSDRSDAALRRVVRDYKPAFPVVIDPGGDIQQVFGDYLSSCVIVGPDGRIEDVLRYFGTPGPIAAAAQSIRAGRRLVSDEELADRLASDNWHQKSAYLDYSNVPTSKMATSDPVDSGAEPPHAFEERNPERLAAEIVASCFLIKPQYVDADGDGQRELAYVDSEGDIAVHVGGSSKPRRTIVGTRELLGSVRELVTLRNTPNGTQWLLAGSVFTDRGGIVPEIQLIGTHGEMAWKYVPLVSGRLSWQVRGATFVDVDGDGACEVAVALEGFRSSFRCPDTAERSGGNAQPDPGPHSILIIISPRGKTLAQRRIADDVTALWAEDRPPGTPGAVLVASEAGVKRYTWKVDPTTMPSAGDSSALRPADQPER